ncbi:MAG TPA: hypothetical protein VM425_08455 [Myxococcota bacterium]|nr:hypothetical protein [Myxococcota bacterium]
MRRISIFIFYCSLAGAVGAGCYFTPKTMRSKADPSFLSEVEAEQLIQKKLALYGINFVSNMKLKRDNVLFVADGYDRDLRVGYEYRSHEGMDFENDGNAGGDGLSGGEIEAIEKRQKEFREYFLIVPEGTRSDIDSAVDKFIKDLYSWNVLKKAKEKKTKDTLFPEESKKKTDKDLLPWESTKDLRKKRKEMEAKEKLEGKPGEKETTDDWDSSDNSGGSEDWGGEKDGQKESGKKSNEDDEEDF